MKTINWLRNKLHYVIIVTVLFFVYSCNNNKKLPVYGKVPVVTSHGVDSVDFKLGNFRFTDHKGVEVTSVDVRGKVAITDFFFTSCPSICPKMKKEMLRIYEKYKGVNDVVLLSFSIDPKRDTVQKLNAYAQKLGIDDNKIWHFLTGNKDSIYNLAESLMIQASEDESAAGGFVHNGKFVLFDKQGRIRGFYDGTNEESVTILLNDMDILLKEK